MPWDDAACKQHSRVGLRYPSDLTDREWALLEPLLPPAKRGGRPRTTDLRTVQTRCSTSQSAAASRCPAGHLKNAREGAHEVIRSIGFFRSVGGKDMIAKLAFIRCPAVHC